VLFVLVILARERRRDVRIAVTNQPTAARTASKILESGLAGTESPRHSFRLT
jgi:hypothetical protein